MTGTRVLVRVAIALAAIWPAALHASLNYSSIGSTHSEDFDSLAASGVDLPWANDFTLPDWYLYRVQSNVSVNPPVAITMHDASDGSSGNPRFYSFGPAAGDTTDRALGVVGHGNLNNFGGSNSVGAGALIGWIAIGVTNTTGSQLTQFTVAYAGEQWHDGGNDPATAQTMSFEYGFGATFGSVGTWAAPGGNFNWASPVATLIEGAVDGNSAGRVAGRGGTISDQVWASGSTLWLRWVERNDIGIDHGLAIDDFSFSATTSAVPEPGAHLFGLLAGGLAVAAMVLRRLFGR